MILSLILWEIRNEVNKQISHKSRETTQETSSRPVCSQINFPPFPAQLCVPDMETLARLLCLLIYRWVRAMRESGRRLERKRKEEARALLHPPHSLWVQVGQMPLWFHGPGSHWTGPHSPSVLWMVPALGSANTVTSLRPFSLVVRVSCWGH